MSRKGGVPNQLQVWWHGMAALPADRQDHAYHALRRVWGDQTLAGGRGFYRPRSEDHITLALLQNWAVLPDTNWVTPIVHAVGGCAGTVTKVRWAYACEEELDDRLRPFHGRPFVIPDIMLEYEDERGTGLVVFEVKPPDKATEAKDDRKLETYVDLPSTRGVARRYGCLLVSERMAEKSSQACNGNWPVLTWERLGELQIAAASDMALPPTAIDRVAHWIGWHFKRYGIRAKAIEAAPAPSGSEYGTEDGYRAIEALSFPKRVQRFLKGSECVEAVWRGEQPAPPLAWLAEEPMAERVRHHGWQTTADRRVCRWRFDWTPSMERSWP